MTNKKSDGKTLEQVFLELEQVIGRMETEDSLEESFKLYHQGMEMLKVCSDKIDKIEKKMLLLDEDGDAHEFEQPLAF